MLLLLRDIVLGTVVALLVIGVGMAGLLALPPLLGLAFASTLAGLVALWARRRHEQDAGERYALRSPALPEAGGGPSLRAVILSGWGTVMITAMLVGIIAPEIDDVAGVWAAMERYTQSVPGFLALAMFAAVLTPMVEEFAFRGFIQRRIATLASPGTAILVTALLFAAVHAGRPHWSYLLVPFALGIAAGFAVHVSRSVWPAVAIHAAWNGTVTTLILVQRFMPQAAPAEAPVVDPGVAVVCPALPDPEIFRSHQIGGSIAPPG